MVAQVAEKKESTFLLNNNTALEALKTVDRLSDIQKAKLSAPMLESSSLSKDIQLMRVRKLAELLSKRLHIDPPTIKVQYARQRSIYYPHAKTIVLGRNREGCCHSFVHEFAHHATRARLQGKEQLFKPHGKPFKQMLRKVVRMVYKDVNLYPWNNEYRSIRGWYERRAVKMDGEGRLKREKSKAVIHSLYVKYYQNSATKVAPQAKNEARLDKKDLVASIKKWIVVNKSKIKLTHTWMMTFEELLYVKSALETQNVAGLEKVLVEVRARRERQWPTKKVEKK